jgi:hypothetical protein
MGVGSEWLGRVGSNGSGVPGLAGRVGVSSVVSTNASRTCWQAHSGVEIDDALQLITCMFNSEENNACSIPKKTLKVLMFQIILRIC